MLRLKGRLITTHATRDGIRFTKEALERCVKQINEGDTIMPFTLNHDTNRQVGFVVPGSAKLIQLEDEEFAVEAEVNMYETREERLKFFVDIDRKESEVNLDFLGVKAVKIDDTNCPTYWLEENVFSILKIKPKFNRDNLLVVEEPNRILQKGILIDEKIIILFHNFLRRGFSEPNAYPKRLIDRIRGVKIRYPSAELSFLVMPDAISLKSEFKEALELDYAWGPKIPKNLALLKKGVTKHIANEEDKVLDNITETDFWWYEQDKSIMALEIEELRDTSRYIVKNSSKYFPLKYSHLQYNWNTRKVIHFDCAVRVYSEGEYNDRLGKNDISKAGKKSVKVKLFRADGEIEPKDAFDIISLFFINNSDVRKYFDSEVDSS